MKCKFIVSLDHNNQTGLFNSVHNRLKQFSKFDQKIEIINLNFYDSFLTQYLKRLFGVKILHQMEDFQHESLKYNTINIKANILYYACHYINLQFFLYYFYAFKIKKRFYNIDVISAHWGLSCGLLAFWLKKILGTNVIVTYHGSDIHTIPLSKKGWRFALRKVLFYVDGNIFVSQDLLRNAKLIGAINNPQVIYNGIDKNIFFQMSMDKKIEFRKKYHSYENIIGFIGNFVDVKNAFLLPDIFLEINNKTTQATFFILIGEGQHRSIIESRLKEYKLNYIFTGKLAPYEVAQYLNCLDLLVLPSKNEGFSIVLCEALSCGCQCIGSRVGGIPEAIGIENTIELSKSFIQDFSNLAINKLNNRHLIIEHNISSWEDIYMQEVSFYNEAMKSNEHC